MNNRTLTLEHRVTIIEDKINILGLDQPTRVDYLMKRIDNKERHIKMLEECLVELRKNNAKLGEELHVAKWNLNIALEGNRALAKVQMTREQFHDE